MKVRVHRRSPSTDHSGPWLAKTQASARPLVRSADQTGQARRYAPPPTWLTTSCTSNSHKFHPVMRHLGIRLRVRPQLQGAMVPHAAQLRAQPPALSSASSRSFSSPRVRVSQSAGERTSRTPRLVQEPPGALEQMGLHVRCHFPNTCALHESSRDLLSSP